MDQLLLQPANKVNPDTDTDPYPRSPALNLY